MVLIMFSFSFIPSLASGDDITVNIALNMPYTVEYGASVVYSYSNFTEYGIKYDIDDGKCLTDGKFGGVNSSGDGYYTAFRGYSRLVCFDFGKEMRISGFSGSFLHYNAGIYSPTVLNIYLSADGEKYVKCGSLDTLPIYSTTPKKHKYTLNFDTPYKARYVKIEFTCEVFVYCDEIEIYGGNNTAGCLDIPPYTEIADKGVYPKFSDNMNGAGSIIKIYDGYLPDQAKADNSKDELLPYIAYLDKNGNILDTMFDSVAFVPCHTDYPSGGRLVLTTGKDGGIMSDWELYISSTFKDGYNVKALEQAAGEVNAALGTSKKVKVFLTIPYPVMQDKPFGDIDGDGSVEYTRNLAERLEVIKWYVDKVVGLFNDQNFANLELCGFYWYKETIGHEVSDHEGELIAGTKRYITEKYGNLRMLFDAYYLSAGFDTWGKYGFDGAVMQPNLVFKDYFKTEMLGEFAEQVKKFGVGVEIETGEPGNYNNAQNIKKYGAIYENYLFYGAKYGYIDALQTFYQGAGPGVIYKFYTSTDPYMNHLYEKTYKFIKGTYSSSPPAVSAESMTVEVNSKRNRIELAINTDSYLPYNTISAKADNGSVSVLSSSNLLFYSPNNGFEGTDNITVTVTDAFNQTTEYSFTVTVEGGGDSSDESTDLPGESGDSSENAESGGNSQEAENEKPKKAFPFYVFVVAVTIAAATGLFIALTRTKKKRI